MPQDVLNRPRALPRIFGLAIVTMLPCGEIMARNNDVRTLLIPFMQAKTTVGTMISPRT